jgi:2-oxoglutarate dehydrogenase E1 component
LRALGHHAARIDPLGLHDTMDTRLDPAAYGFTPEHLKQLFPCAGLYWAGPLPLREIIERLQQTYCKSIEQQRSFWPPLSVKQRNDQITAPRD